MTANVVPIHGNALSSEEPQTPAATNDGAPGGWDPFEVWRTRVLLPRLEESRPNADLPEIGTAGSVRQIGKT